MDMLRSNIEEQRRRLEQELQEPLDRIARHLSQSWSDREALTAILKDSIREVPHCTYLYALNTGGIQVSDNVSHAGLLPEHFGRDRSAGVWLGNTG